MDIKYLKKKSREKTEKNDVKFGVGKMKIKTYVVVFSNPRSTLELMICNQNLTKLDILTLLSFNCRA